MRNQLRLLLLQRSHKPLSTLHHKVQYYSSPTLPPLYPNPTFPFPRFFSSSSTTTLPNNNNINNTTILEQPILTSTLIELYSDQNKTNEDVMSELKSKHNLDTLSDDVSDDVIGLFKNRGSDGSGGRDFYDWVMKMNNGGDDLGSSSCNRLLGMLGGSGLVKEFWEFVEVMRTKGYGVKKGASVRAMAKFEELGLGGDVEKLKELFKLGSVDVSVEKVGLRVCRVIAKGPWGDDVETKLKEMGVVYTSDLVKLVLESFGSDVNKAVIFFRWIEESGLYKHDEGTYNAIVREVGREEYMDKLWKLIDEMRAKGFDLEKATYVRVLNRFVKKKMLKDAVDLYEFAMGGNAKPSLQDCPFLLKKIVTSEKLDMELFSRVLKIYKEGGNTLTNAVLDSVLKSLTSVGRFNECNKILRAMEEVNFFPDENLQSKIGFQLSKNSKTEEAGEFHDFIKSSNAVSSVKTLGSLIDGYCVSGHLDKACDCFQKLIENEGSSYAGYALETLTNAYCSKESAIEAYKLLSEAVIEKEVKPWHTTYKLLISKLLDQGLFNEATNLFAPMKAHGYPPYLDPFVKYVAKKGTTDEALMFLKAMTNKRVPSTAVYMRVFTAYFKAGRHNEAQDFLSKCPRFIRNHVDVLNLFSDMKRVKDKAASTTPVAA